MKHNRDEIKFDWEDYIDKQSNLPVLDEKQMKLFINLYPDQKERVNSLVCFLTDGCVRNVPRSKVLTMNNIEVLFNKATIMRLEDVSIPLKNQYVQMKHEDYTFDIGVCLLITQLGNQFNDVSDYFQRYNRMMCGGYNRISPNDVWKCKDVHAMKGVISSMMRLSSKNKIDISDYTAGTRLASTVYMAAQFKVHVATAVYKFFSACNVIDFSMGWGDRLAGYFCANQGHRGTYYGCDPNVFLHSCYTEQINAYTKWSVNGTDLTIKHFEAPAEDVDWSCVPDNTIDLIFTSPPYGDTERYAASSECEKNQSWSRYSNNEIWMSDFCQWLYVNWFVSYVTVVFLQSILSMLKKEKNEHDFAMHFIIFVWTDWD